jgi:aminoglycoside phosphotransferase (APT) family kinase protein
MINDDAQRERRIRRLGYEPVTAFKVKQNRWTYHVRQTRSDYVLKAWPSKRPNDPPYPAISYRVLQIARLKYKRLVLPEVVETGFERGIGHYIVMPLLTGEAYPWSHEHPATAGGRALDIGSIIALLETLDDLSTVPSLDLIEAGLRVSKPKKAPSSCNGYLAPLLKEGLVSKSEAGCALNLVVSWASTRGFDSPATVSNGDFRFGNFLNVSEKRTAILDWDDARVSSFELERCVARLWVFCGIGPTCSSLLCAPPALFLVLTETRSALFSS